MIIYDTDKKETVNLTHPYYQCDCMPDLTAEDEYITYNEDEDRYEASTEAIEWWQEYITADNEVCERLAELKARLDHWQEQELMDEISFAGCCDLGDQPAAHLSVIKEWEDELCE